MSIYSDYIGKYCIIRSRDQGVMSGFVEGIEGRVVKLRAARQLYAWTSHFVLVELASNGPATKEQRYSMPSAEPVLMLEACGVLPCTERAAAMIQDVPPETHNN